MSHFSARYYLVKAYNYIRSTFATVYNTQEQGTDQEEKTVVVYSGWMRQPGESHTTTGLTVTLCGVIMWGVLSVAGFASQILTLSQKMGLIELRE